MTEILQGDCLEVMKSFPDNHFSGVVTDPPYGLHFMGKDWDCFKKTNFDERGDYKHLPEYQRKGVRSIFSANANSGTYDETRNDEFQSFITQFGIEAMRIVKPGGHILMCGAPRRYHRQACGLEDAGWEIRDCLCWLFGSGFPKSHNHYGPEGYGTALKPAYEPIIMAMKPCEGTFKQNYEKWGVGGINIDACRIGMNSSDFQEYKQKRESFNGTIGKKYTGFQTSINNNHIETKGRWPANLLLDEEAAAMLDEQSGMSKSTDRIRKNNGQDTGRYGKINPIDSFGFSDSGGASRFFYCAKTSSRERNEGCEKNAHPTIKPLALMRYLITLISPPTNALILDPFAGSGSTIVAAEQLGIRAIGIEKQPEYVEIARARVLHVAKKASELVEQMGLF